MTIPADRKQWIAVVALLGLVAIAYSNSFSAGFALDNAFLLQEDRIHAFTRENLALIWNHTYWWPRLEGGIYRPLATFSYLFNYAVLENGADPTGYHSINLAIHALNVLLAYAVAWRILGNRSLAFIAAAIWSVHPVLTESVTNIIGRADLLGGTSLLGGLWLYIESRTASGWRCTAIWAGLVAAAVVGVASKESAVLLFPVLVLYEAVWWKRRESFARLSRALPFVLVPSALILAKRSHVLAVSGPVNLGFLENPLQFAGFWQARLTALKVIALNLKVLVWPVTLSSDYSFDQIPLAVGTLADWMCWLAVVGVLGCAALLYRHSRRAFFFIAFGFASISATSNLLLIIGTIMAERFLYVAAFCYSVCLALCIQWVAARSRIRWLSPAIAGLIVLLFGARTWARNRDWETPLILAKAMVQSAPESFRPYRLLAEALEQGDRADANLDAAIAAGEKGLSILDRLPDKFSAWEDRYKTAVYHARKGDLLSAAGTRGDANAQRAAAAEWERSKVLLLHGIAMRKFWVPSPSPANPFPQSSSNATLYRTLSGVYRRMNLPEQEYEAAVNARRFGTFDPQAIVRLGESLIEQGRGQEAAQLFLEGLLYNKEESLKSAFRALYSAHPEYFDLPAQCAALRTAENRLAGVNGRVNSPELTARCGGR